MLTSSAKCIDGILSVGKGCRIPGIVECRIMIRLEELAELIVLSSIVKGVIASESMGVRIIGILMS